FALSISTTGSRRTVRNPEPSRRRLCAGHHPDSKQVPAGFIPGQHKLPVLMSSMVAFDTCMTVHWCSSSWLSPDAFSCTFSITLTTQTFDPSRLWWFEICSCKPIPKGLPPSSILLMRHTYIGDPGLADMTNPHSSSQVRIYRQLVI